MARKKKKKVKTCALCLKERPINTNAPLKYYFKLYNLFTMGYE